MNKNQIIAFILVASGLALSILLHLGIMFDCIPFDQKYILYIHLFMIVALWPVVSISKDGDSDVYIEDTFKTALKVLPLWLSIGLGVILVYSVLMFINFTYINKPLADKSDLTGVLTKFSKGSSAATMFFYAAAFGLLNLDWKVKKDAKEKSTVGRNDLD